ncbi:MAG: hypothetical protein ACJ73S_14755 [Mycobacteriales bacterium]
MLKTGFGRAPDSEFAYAVALIRNGTDKLAGLDPSGKLLATREASAPVARSGATVATGVPLEVKPGTDAATDVRIEKGSFDVGHHVRCLCRGRLLRRIR